MLGLEPSQVACPYCGEEITLLVDCSIAEQEYIEDCQVCCRPILCRVSVSVEGKPSVSVHHENE